MHKPLLRSLFKPLATPLFNPLTHPFSSTSPSSPTQAYRPLVPLTQPYNLIYNHKRFAKGELFKTLPVWYYLIPAGLVAVNNYLTSWTLGTSALFGVMVVGGLYMKGVVLDFKSIVVYSVQVDPEIRNVYITVSQSPLTLMLANVYQVTPAELEPFLSSYHPSKQKNPSLKIVTKLESVRKNPQLSPDYKATMKIQKQVYRLKIPIEKLKFQVFLNANDKKSAADGFRKDLEKLTVKEMMRKYEDSRIQVMVLGAKGEPLTVLPLNIDCTQNNNRRYHDYLLSMAMGYKIDLSGNKIKKQSKDPETESQKNSSQKPKQSQASPQKQSPNPKQPKSPNK